jgi:hypothetical protein
MGGGRPARRALSRGGEGIAAALHGAIQRWEGVRITPMMGRWGYLVGHELFGCYPIRAKDRDLWVRLDEADQRRALTQPGVRPHRRLAARGWIECDVAAGDELYRALRWLRRGYEAVRARAHA